MFILPPANAGLSEYLHYRCVPPHLLRDPQYWLSIDGPVTSSCHRDGLCRVEESYRQLALILTAFPLGKKLIEVSHENTSHTLVLIF